MTVVAEFEPVTRRRMVTLIRHTVADDCRHAGQAWRQRCVAALPQAVGTKIRNPLFVIGAPRSGTTVVANCIRALPGVSYHFEPIATKAAVPHVYTGDWSFERSRRYFHFVYGLLLAVRRHQGLRFAEKTPQNSFIVPFLNRAFPGSRFLHIVRDGRDAALSWSETSWLSSVNADSGRREPGGHLIGPYPRFWVEPDRLEEFRRTTDIHRCIWGWRRHVQAARTAGSTLGPDAYLEVRYERLANGDSAEVERLASFLDVATGRGRLLLDRELASLSSRSIGRWRPRLKKDDLRAIESEAGALLASLDELAGS